MNALELHGVQKTYPGFTLGPIDLTLPGGTVCAAAAGAEGTGDRRRCGNVLRHIVQLL